MNSMIVANVVLIIGSHLRARNGKGTQNVPLKAYKSQLKITYIISYDGNNKIHANGSLVIYASATRSIVTSTSTMLKSM